MYFPFRFSNNKLENLIVTEFLKEFPALHEIRSSIVNVTIPLYQMLLSDRLIRSIPSNLTSSHLHVGLSRYIFP
jgi:hypothetical protein